MGKIRWKLKEGATWRQKLEREHVSHGRIEPIPSQWQAKMGTGTMLIPRPLHVEAIMRRVRKGSLLTIGELRARLAKDAGADTACPLTTGMFMRIVAEAAEEDARAGRKRITPYWRTIRDDGKLIDKFPGGAAAQAKRLRAEGFKIAPAKGKQPPRVDGFPTKRAKR